MKNVSLPIGTADFRSIREAGKYYVDKTSLVSGVIRDNGSSLLFTRPRRFGKTTALTMLRSFFDIREESNGIFSGLEVMSDNEAVNEWMNRFPVIYLTLKGIDGLDFDGALSMLQGVIYNLYDSFEFLASMADKKGDGKFVSRILSGTFPVSDVRRSLEVLAKLLHSYYQKRVIILIDEYDVPLDKACQNGYYPQMLEIMRTMFSSVLKDNPDVEKAVLTGCLRISKESLFTGLNNLSTYSLTSPKFTESFGFTEEETARLLHDTGFTDKAEMIRKWYDGYRIGSSNIYAPWDVLRFVDILQADRDSYPENFWANTSGNDVIRNLIDITNASVSGDYSTLIDGGVISKRITENLTYNELYSDENNIWSMMFETGYLTLAERWNENAEVPLRLPNEEMRQLFISIVDKWFADEIRKNDRGPLYNALWAGDCKTISDIISGYLEMSISYHDYSEDFYHAFVTGLLTASPYRVISNRETGLGRSDLLILDIKNRRAAVLEFKVAQSPDSIKQAAESALSQISERKYGVELDRYSVISYGVVFYRKSAYVVRR